MDREVRPYHKAPGLSQFNREQAPDHQRRAGKASWKGRRKRGRKRKGRPKRPTRRRRGKRRPVHRLVAERIIGRSLSSDEVVHHIDENTKNNDPANLVIGITRAQHQNIHAQYRKGTRPKVFSLLKRRGSVPGLRYRFKTRPYRHQIKALKKLIFRRGGGLLCEMGTGKSKIAIDFACAMHYKTGVDRVVVVCPKSVIGVWKLEIKKHAPEKIRHKIKWVILNYDQLSDREVKGTLYKGKMHVLKKFLDRGTSVLIADESHLMKRPSAARSKAMYKMSQSADYRLILTGTPLTKDVRDFYQQFKFLDERIFGTSKKDFERRYCVFGGYGNYELLRYINLDDFKKKAKPYIFQVKKEDCLDLPSRTDQIVPVKLTGETKRVYEEMAKEGIVAVENEEIETDIILTRILRLQQISSGFLKGGDGEIKRFGKDKLKQLEGDLIQFKESERDKAVIFVQFLPDLKACAETVRDLGYNVLLLHGKVPQPIREQRLCEFDETEEPTVFISQIAAGSLGISLTAASDAIFFSHTRNFAQFAQAKDRLHRIGQHHPVIYRHYIAPGVDQAIWMANRAKKNVADLILDKPHLLMEEGYSP